MNCKHIPDPDTFETKGDEKLRVDADAQPDSISNAVTKISLKSFYYTWTVDNFVKCLSFANPKIFSPEFSFENTNWRLLLQAFSEDDKLKEIKIRLLRSDKGETAYYIKYKFSIFNGSGFRSEREAESTFQNDLTYGHRLTFTLHEDKEQSLLVKDDELIVHCDLLVLSTVDCNDSVPVSNATHNSIEEIPQPVSQTSRNQNRKPLSSCPKCKFVRGKQDVMEHLPRNEIKHLIFVSFIVLIIIFVMKGFTEVPGVSKLSLSYREINELIIDSTLKIKNIAEVLNLTDIKIKSSELLIWYHKNYISDLVYQKNVG